MVRSKHRGVVRLASRRTPRTAVFCCFFGFFKSCFEKRSLEESQESQKRTALFCCSKLQKTAVLGARSEQHLFLNRRKEHHWCCSSSNVTRCFFLFCCSLILSKQAEPQKKNRCFLLLTSRREEPQEPLLLFLGARVSETNHLFQKN